MDLDTEGEALLNPYIFKWEEGRVALILAKADQEVNVKGEIWFEGP